MSLSIESFKIAAVEDKSLVESAEKVRSLTEKLRTRPPEKFSVNLIQQDGLLSSRRRMSRLRR